MTGEYPVRRSAVPRPALPVQLELSAFSPFAPARHASSRPCPLAAFVFRIQNPTASSRCVSLAALMQNPVGYDAAGDNEAAAATRPSAAT